MSNQPRFVRVKRFSELTGYTESAVRSKISDGVWGEGIHYKRAPDSCILMDLDAYEAWVDGKRMTQAVNDVLAGKAPTWGAKK